MMISFKFAFFLTGILIAQVVCPAPPESRKEAEQDSNPTETAETPENTETEPQNQEPANELNEAESDQDDYLSDDEDNDEFREEEHEPLLPFLTCVLFEDDKPCNALCSMIGSIYGNPITSGVCGEENECKCNIAPNATLEDYWGRKFNSENILRDISKSKDLSKKILVELKTPFKTPQQTIQSLRSLLSARQLKNLRVKDPENQKLFLSDGKFDQNAVKKFVAGQLKSFEKPADGYDYKKTLVNVLNSANKDVFDYISDEIRRSRNKLLNSILDRYIKEHNIQKNPSSTAVQPSNNDQQTLVDVLDIAVINQLIKPTLPARKTSAEENTVLNLSSSRSRSSKLASKPVSDNPAVILRGFDKTKAIQLKKGKKCWEDPSNYNVCLYKSNAKQSLEWNNEKHNVSVDIQITNGNVINQKWTVGNTRVALNRDAKGITMQQWVLESSMLEIMKDAEGRVRKNAWSGPRNQEAIDGLKSFINSWCARNDYFLGKDSCVIY